MVHKSSAIVDEDLKHIMYYLAAKPSSSFIFIDILNSWQTLLVYKLHLVVNCNHMFYLESFCIKKSAPWKVLYFWDPGFILTLFNTTYFTNTNPQGGAIWPHQCILFLLPLKLNFVILFYCPKRVLGYV